MKVKDIIIKLNELINELNTSLNKEIIVSGKKRFEGGDCCILSQSVEKFVFHIDGHKEVVSLSIETTCDYETNEDETVERIESIYPSTGEWDSNSYACLLQMHDLLETNSNKYLDHKQYSQEGMIRRVMNERRQKALHADYRVKWAGNIYGDHILTNEQGVKYKIFLRDFENETGYRYSIMACSSYQA